MNKSESINELATALCNAQSAMGGAVKDSKNPFFKSSYADLTSVIKAIKQPFADNGLSYTQFPVTSEGGQGIGVKTVLMHISGQYLESEFYLPITKSDPQAGGSAITYARRYALQAMAGIPTADDDAEAAMMRGKPVEPDIVEEQLKANKEAYDRNFEVMQVVKSLLSQQTPGSIAEAKSILGKLDEEDQIALWSPSPTKGNVAFTTQERTLLKTGVKDDN